MYRIISASKDTYITNKIINSKFRATDSNLGQAGSLDLFKLYAENVSGSDTTPTELSRILIKFDLDEVIEMHNDKKIDVGDSSFKAELCLHDIYGGQTTPNNFHIITFPLAKDFDEGAGSDVVNYADLDATNFITASFPGVGQPIASTATLSISDGDDNSTSNLPAEKETIIITSTDGTAKTYVFVDDAKTDVATGDILASDSDTGDNVAGDDLVGGIAVAINMSGTPSTQAAVLNQLRLAILNSSGHLGKISVSSAVAETDGSKSITLTQAVTGYDGNRIITNSSNGITVTEFTGGAGGVQRWHIPGATRSGSLGDPNIDVIVSGTITGQAAAINLAPVQYFQSGEEDLKADVTHFVSASIKGLVQNNGFLVAFSGSYEKDNYTYFVKRFASRNTTNEAIRPKLLIKYDDTLSDNHQNFEFDVSGSLYLNNFNRGSLSNILSGSSASELTGENCMILKMQTGSFSKQFNVSQVLRGTSKKATLTINVTGNPANDQTFILEDSLTNKTQFTFNTANNIVSAGSRNIGIASALDNNATIATRIQNAINNDSINITAAAAGTNVVLTQDFAGELGNTTLDLTGVTGVALSTGTGFAGGSYDGLTGIYKSSFAISSFDSNLYNHVLTSGSIEFNEIWSNHSETVTYLSSSLKISKNNVSAINFRENRYLVALTNLKQRYRQDEYSRLRVFIENADRSIVFTKTPLEKPSEIFSNVYYRVRDFGSGNIIVPFDEGTNSTKLSSDNIGMYFDFYMSSLPSGRSYVFDFLIKQNGFDIIVKDAASKFIID